jgi:excinuclease UvrABC nuclease subunit
MTDESPSFDGAVAVEPPLSDQQLAQVPAKRGVVGLLADGDLPIVLLTAADIRARLRTRLAQRDPLQRHKTADLREITRRITWKLAHGHLETEMLYLDLARRWWPDDYASMLGWRLGWFVCLDPQAQYPRLVRTHDVPGAGGTCVGPFASGKAAGTFIEIIEDAMGLCRDIRCLRLSPNAPPCPYAQMGKCASVCDGTMSLDDYRKLAARAAGVLAGDRTYAQELHAAMQSAASELRFEHAGRLKARLQRLGELDKPLYAQARRLEDFRFLCVQPGPTSRSASTFFVQGGQWRQGPSLAHPASGEQIESLLADFAAYKPTPGDDYLLERWRIGLICSYLFSSPARRGVMLRDDSALTPASLAQAIEAQKDDLGLRTPVPRRKKDASKKDGPAADTPR